MTGTTIDSLETPLPAQRGEILIRLIIAFLAPMFLGVCEGDVRLARLAAVETVNAYRAEDSVGLIAAAQIIAFGLAALGSLSLSMDHDISVVMALRLRGNANACNRSAERNRRALQASVDRDPLPDATVVVAEADIPAPVAEDSVSSDTNRLLSTGAEQVLAAEAQARLDNPPPIVAEPPEQEAEATARMEKRHREMQAIAMVKEAAEINAILPDMPPAEREAAIARAAMLGGMANRILYGAPGTGTVNPNHSPNAPLSPSGINRSREIPRPR